MKKILTIAATAILSLSLIAGCGTTGASSNAGAGGAGGGTIKIGADYELTGGVAMYGQETLNGVKLAIDQQNAKGGVLGKQLELDVADNKSDPGESTAAVTKLVTQDKVVGVIGAATSSDTLAAVQVVTDNKIPMISAGATNTKVTVDDNGQVRPYLFRACFIDSFQGKVAAKFALNTLKAKTAAVIIDQKSDYSKGLADAFVTNFKDGGGTITGTEQYVAGGDKDFRPILTRLKAQNPDLVWVPGYYQEVGLIVKQARELEMQMPFAGGDGWDDPKLFEIGTPAALNNTYYVDHVATDAPDMVQFVKDYNAKFGHEPSTVAALGYDAANMFIKAIQDAGSADSGKIRDALEKLKDFKGVTGVITIDPATHNPTKSAVIKQNKDGKSVYLTTVTP